MSLRLCGNLLSMETVILKSFDNYFSASIILGRLQDAGINCFLVDEHSVTIYPILGNAIGGIKLAVTAEDAPNAQLMLDAFEEEYMRAATCPRCKHNEIISIPRNEPKSFLTAVLTWLFSSYAIPAEYVYHCNHCGYESKTLPEDNAANN
jgi:hypothetical protein